jgi:mono/diheme cytochrome c family protein
LLTFALNGKQTLAKADPPEPVQVTPLEFTASKETIAAGAGLFAQHCTVCHGIGAVGGGGVLPDLKLSAPATFNKYQAIVLDGALAEAGMPGFKPLLKAADVEAIQAYILSLRNQLAQKK